jgi:membrane-bound ClpP family serine protease
MSIGAGVVLFVIGAILRFALNMELTWIDLMLVGNILMGAGVVVFVLGLIFTFRKRQSTSTRRTVIDPGTGETHVRRTARTDETEL